jgi:hypothetical protein
MPFRPSARAAARVFATGLALVLAACGGGGGGGAPQEIRVRVLHLAADAPRVNVLVDGNIVRASLDYKTGTGFLSVTSERAYDFAVDAILPSGNERVLDLPDRSLAASTEYTIAAVGLAGTEDLEAVEFDNPISDVPGGQWRVQLVHAVPPEAVTPPAVVGQVYVFITDATADLVTADPAATLDYRQVSGQLLNPSGDYRIRITPTTDRSNVIFDSGVITFAAGRDLVVAVVPNTIPGSSPVSLVADNGAGQPQIFDAATPVNVRAVHLSANTPEIRVVADPDTTGSPDVDVTAAFASGLPYPEFTAYQTVPPDRYTVRATEFATPATQAFSFTQTYVLGSRVSVLLVGRKASGTTASSQAPVTLFESVRPIANVAQLRFVNASSEEPRVDLYVLASDQPISGQFPAATGISLGAATAYLQFTPGTSYVVKLARANTSTEVAAAGVNLKKGGAVTLFARDQLGGTTPVVQLLEEIVLPGED